MKIGVVVGGGSCPGINPLLFHLAHCRGYELVYFRGWDGLLKQTPVAGIVPTYKWITEGGSVIGTSRYKPTDDDIRRMEQGLRESGFDGLIGIGGNDTLSVVGRFRDFKVIGIPKTLDADLSQTEVTLGHWSVLEHLVQSVINTLSSLRDHNRFLVVETIGQNVGWLALRAANILKADLAIIPEFSVKLSHVLQLVKHRPTGLILVTESATIEGLSVPAPELHTHDLFQNKLYLKRHVGERLADAIAAEYGFDARCEVLRDSIRGGAPCAFDIHLAMLFANRAMSWMEQHDSQAPMALIYRSPDRIDLAPAGDVAVQHFVSGSDYAPWARLLQLELDTSTL